MLLATEPTIHPGDVEGNLCSDGLYSTGTRLVSSGPRDFFSLDGLDAHGSGISWKMVILGVQAQLRRAHLLGDLTHLRMVSRIQGAYEWIDGLWAFKAH